MLIKKGEESMDIKGAKQLAFISAVILMLYFFYIAIFIMTDQFDQTLTGFSVELPIYTKLVIKYSFSLRFVAMIAGLQLITTFINFRRLPDYKKKVWGVIKKHIFIAVFFLIFVFVGLYFPVVQMGSLV